MIETNEHDLSMEKSEFSKLCIQKADMVAYFIAHEPNTINDLEAVQKLAQVMDVDEIHFFNKQGEIYAGTHPEYYGYTVYSGEQMNFFEQMLWDTTLKVCQDILPNTAEGKEMQYAAVWLKDGSGFVQIGMRPERLLTLMEEKSLQSIVRSIPFESKEHFHVIDLKEGKITASSSDQIAGKDFSEEIRSFQRENAFETAELHRDHNGEKYCVYTKVFGEYLMVHAYDSKYLLSETIASSMMLLLSVLLATLGVIAVFLRYVHKHILNNLLLLNEELKKIEMGDLEKLDMETQILEFNTLIYYIDQLLQSIRFDNKRIQEIMDSGQISFGIFEYNSFYRKFYLNQCMKNILGIDLTEKRSFDIEKDIILEKLKEIEKNQVDPAQGIYRYHKGKEILYVKLKKYSDKQSGVYYLSDVSSWWNQIRVLQDDSFKDVLTGLLNRRGIQESAKQIFATEKVLREAGVILLDADGLKRINDFYGHSVGDAYLKEIGGILSALPSEHTISARLGGDEFLIIIYGCDTKEDVDGIIKELTAKRGTPFLPFRLEREERLEFSMGYAYVPSEGKKLSGTDAFSG